ncbi:hypothetical protein ACJQWY_04815 [Weissella kandleri]|uniref:hypothetical protein n=1 Tax=Weissella kandleri TaxID=1616 RepID=UPI00387E41A0
MKKQVAWDKDGWNTVNKIAGKNLGSISGSGADDKKDNDDSYHYKYSDGNKILISGYST